MSLTYGIAVYFLLWWLSFFATLPLGAQSAHEAGQATQPGIERGAPLVHNLKFKVLIAACIAAVLWLVLEWGLSSGWLLKTALSQDPVS